MHLRLADGVLHSWDLLPGLLLTSFDLN